MCNWFIFQNTTELEGGCNQLEAKEEYLQKKLNDTLAAVSARKTDM